MQVANVVFLKPVFISYKSYSTYIYEIFVVIKEFIARTFICL